MQSPVNEFITYTIAIVFIYFLGANAREPTVAMQAFVSERLDGVEFFPRELWEIVLRPYAWGELPQLICVYFVGTQVIKAAMFNE